MLNLNHNPHKLKKGEELVANSLVVQEGNVIMADEFTEFDTDKK